MDPAKSSETASASDLARGEAIAEALQRDQQTESNTMSKKHDTDNLAERVTERDTELFPIHSITGRTAGNLPTGELAADYILGPGMTEKPAQAPAAPPSRDQPSASDS